MKYLAMPQQVLQQTINTMVDSVCGILAVYKSSPVIAFHLLELRLKIHFILW